MTQNNNRKEKKKKKKPETRQKLWYIHKTSQGESKNLDAKDIYALN